MVFMKPYKIPRHRDGNIVYAATPGGLLRQNDLLALRRALLLAGPHMDELRQDVFREAGINFCGTPGGPIRHIALFGWPVAVTWSQSTRIFPNLSLATGKADPNAEHHLVLQAWNAAAKGSGYYGVSPLRLVTHLKFMLGLTPLDVRDCLAHGIKMFSGTAPESAWVFSSTKAEEPVRTIAHHTTVFMMGAYVAWEFRAPLPTLSLSHEARLKFTQIFQSLFGTDEAHCPQVHLGNPELYHMALEQGHRLQVGLAAKNAQYAQLNYRLDITRGDVPDTTVITEVHSDPVEPTESNSTQSVFLHLWRSSGHLASLHTAIDQAFAADGSVHPRSLGGGQAGPFHH